MHTELSVFCQLTCPSLRYLRQLTNDHNQTYRVRIKGGGFCVQIILQFASLSPEISPNMAVIYIFGLKIDAGPPESKINVLSFGLDV